MQKLRLVPKCVTHANLSCRTKYIQRSSSTSAWWARVSHFDAVHDLHIAQWGRVTYICVSNLTTIGSDNGLSPERCQAIIWTSAWILSIGTLGTNFSEILREIRTSSFKKIYLKTSSAKWRPFGLGLNVKMGHGMMVPVSYTNSTTRNTFYAGVIVLLYKDVDMLLSKDLLSLLFDISTGDTTFVFCIIWFLNFLI